MAAVFQQRLKKYSEFLSHKKLANIPWELFPRNYNQILFNNMNNNQQAKPNPKGKAIASFVLGVIAVTGPLSSWITIWGPQWARYFFPQWWLYHFKIYNTLSGLVFHSPLSPIIWGLLGLILGIMGLKSSKKIFARIGIGLSIFSILLEIVVFMRVWGEALGY